MSKWAIEGFRSGNPTGFSREVDGAESRVKLLLERLAARHLTDDEITDATCGSRTDLKVHKDKQPGKPMVLMTTGSDHHYVARQTDYAARSKGEMLPPT